MKTRNITLTTIFLLLFCVKTAAQSFNTISDSRPRYKAEQAPVYINKEVPPESNTSHVDNNESADTTTIPSPKETEQTEHPLQVSYPLRQEKLVITSSYGWRIHPKTHKKSFHSGVDLRANYEIVLAMLDGEVLNIGYEPKGGNFISLKHGPIQVIYCHLSYITVKKGDTVFAGQPIGVSGNSGSLTTGPHLHIEVKDAQTGQPISAQDLFYVLGFNR